jgi:hypothetical protein
MHGSYPAVLFELEEYLKGCTFNLSTGHHDDGRVVSIEKEKDVINRITEKFECIIPPPRHWYDIAIMSNERLIHCNIKISTGKTDNAMSKKGLIHSLTDLHENNIKGNLTYDAMKALIESNLLIERDFQREYYYIYIDKLDGTIIIRSMLDIIHYQSNPCNILQINWSKEKKTKCLESQFDLHTSRKRIEKVIAKSQKQYIDNNCAYYKHYYVNHETEENEGS